MNELHHWFTDNRREFPWRDDPTPYKVWVSEVMLQQTRANVVISYFQRWLDLFPDVFTLAKAPIEVVIKAWEGLGYYSRARNLHRGAREICERFGGIIPDAQEELESISGLGPYTVGAILSFGFHKKAAAVDGNVVRVISRYDKIEGNVDRARVKKYIKERVESLLDRNRPWVTMEALIELGALVCTRNPKCECCPLKDGCLGKGVALSLPIKNESQKIERLSRFVAVIECRGKFLVKKGEKGKVMADLYEFPYFEMDFTLTRHQMVKMVQDFLGIEVEIQEILPEIKHSFTKYLVKLYPARMIAKSNLQIEGYEWICHNKLSLLPFSSGHKRILGL